MIIEKLFNCPQIHKIVLIYILLILCFSLIGIAGLQFSYMFYIDRLDRARKRRVAELERECIELKYELSHLKVEMRAQELAVAADKRSADDEVWADIIED